MRDVARLANTCTLTLIAAWTGKKRPLMDIRIKQKGAKTLD
jgi:hypothetical protein